MFSDFVGSLYIFEAKLYEKKLICVSDDFCVYSYQYNLGLCHETICCTLREKSLAISYNGFPHRRYFHYQIFIPPANFVCRGYTVFTLSVRPSVRVSVRPSVTLCFLNILKSHCWIFIKPCKHVHICKTNFLDKKVRARGQFCYTPRKLCL